MLERIKRWLRGEKKVYKVVRASQGKRSCVVDGRALAIYVQGSWTRAPDWLAEEGYWLTCFRTLVAARSFALDHHCRRDRYQIWECDARKVKASLPPMCDVSYLRRGSMMPLASGSWPLGTLMARELKLVGAIPWPWRDTQ